MVLCVGHTEPLKVLQVRLHARRLWRPLGASQTLSSLFFKADRSLKDAGIQARK